MNIPPQLWLPYILLGVAPGIVWMLYYLREDKKNPEPKGKIAQIFLWGMLATIPAMVAEIILSCALGFSCPINSGFSLYFNPLLASAIISSLISVFFVTASAEEIFKYLVARAEVLKNKEFDEPIDAMIYCIAAALGFASAENILFVFTSGGNPFPVMAVRFFTAVLIHALTGGIIGYYIGRVKIEQMKTNQFIPGIKDTNRAIKYQATGIFFAILLHGAYNFLVNIESNIAMLEIIGLIITTAFLVSLGFDKLKSYTLALTSPISYNKSNHKIKETL